MGKDEVEELMKMITIMDKRVKINMMRIMLIMKPQSSGLVLLILMDTLLSIGYP